MNSWLTLDGTSETRHNLGFWDAYGKAASSSIVPGPFLGASRFLSGGKGPALAARAFRYVQLFLLLATKDLDFPGATHMVLSQEKTAFV